MGTKTIGLREEVYERLKARKRSDESFTDVIDRLLSETAPEWRDGFGTLSESEAAELTDLIAESRDRLSEGVSTRQNELDEELADEETDASKTA
ncbi:MAG: antitoxin VapB family protein [Halobacteriales archaeon]